MKLGAKLAASVAGLMLMAGAAFAEFPDRPIEIIVPWPPGDLEDVVARMISEQLQKDFGVPSAVVNMKGGGGVIGASHVAQAEPDGYTVGMFTGNILTAHIIKGRAPFGRDTFEPLAITINYPMALWARSDLPFENVNGLAAYAKEHPVKLGHFGFEGPLTLQTLLAAKTLDFEFAGNAAYDETNCTLLSSGDADVIISSVQLVKSCVASGEAKGIAALTSERLPVMPDMATLDEQVPGIAAPSWAGLFVRAEVPQEVRAKIAASAEKVMQSEAMAELANNTGAVLGWTGGDAAKAYVGEQYGRVESLIGK